MAKRDEGGEVNQRLMRALAHPMRVTILQLLEEAPSSPVRISQRIDESLGSVSYHTNVLADLGLIELVETRPARGAVEHIFRIDPDATLGSPSWRRVPPSLRSSVVGGALNSFTARAIEALRAGTFQARDGSVLSWLPLRVDEQGWAEIAEIVESVEERFRAVGERCGARLENQDDGIPIVVAVAAFETSSRGRGKQ
jgi:DNA-binding transcriptional ArsR family regulator